MKPIETIFKTNKISLTKCPDGFWLYDYVLGLNISMRAKTEIDAMIEGLTYYQKNLESTKDKLKTIEKKVSNFISLFKETENFTDLFKETEE